MKLCYVSPSSPTRTLRLGVAERTSAGLLPHPGLLVCVLALLCTYICHEAHADPLPAVVAAPYSVQGDVSAQRKASTEWTTVQVGNAFRVGDTVRTGADGQVAFKFVDGTLVRLGRLSAITFKEVLPTGAPVVSQAEGKAYYFSRDAKNEPRIETKFVNAAIYGTELVVSVTKQSSTIDVLHGTIEATNAAKTLRATIGERVTATSQQSLAKARLVQTDDSVQWMITFPFIITEQDLKPRDDRTCDESCREAIRRILARYEVGESVTSSLHRESKTFRSSHYGRLLSAIGLWSSGDVSLSRKELDALSEPSSPQVSAIRSTLLGFDALAHGDLALAGSYVDSAERTLPGLVNTALLRSYTTQARGDTEEALLEAQSVAKRHPETSQMLDREAELLLSLDRAEEAEAVLAKRVTLHGASPTTDTLAGFAALSRKEFEKAAALFTTAIKKDSSLSLPYLGQALLVARNRDYQAAKDFLSKAVQLDPSVAVYRSYLGKLFFEDENTEKALHEFEAAIALDPKDPSPYLYRSFAHIANNQPVDALADVEQSIALNDGRAVYRSRLLLDRDLAVRGAGLARAFTELGFSEAARIEAIKSISDDYTNFSAHRLLSDSYDSILDGEANLSEKRIADILSPLSFNLFNSLGEQASLSDYNALFDKKETRKAVRVDWNSNRDRVGGQILATRKQDT